MSLLTAGECAAQKAVDERNAGKVYPLDISEFVRPSADDARLTLPKSPPDDLLSEMMRAYNGAPDYCGWDTKWAAVYRALYAHLAKPKTKEVEVWHIEFAGAAMGNPYIELAESADEAERQAAKRRYEGATCIRVTGPHKQTIPAD